jgi:pimeloyl-ACP methyl ester carboxylesterase
VTTTQNPAIGKSAEANGIRTNYLEAGEGSGQGDKDVVLIHGSGPGVTSYANWRMVLPVLAQDFHVVAPDMVGFGYSDRPDKVSYSLDTWADQTLGLMDTLGIEKANLVGNSFGGGIALRIATRHPDRVGKLVLMGSMGVDFPITEALDNVWGYDGTLEGMRKVTGFFAYDKSLTDGDLAQARYEGATQPGFQESQYPARRCPAHPIARSLRALARGAPSCTRYSCWPLSTGRGRPPVCCCRCITSSRQTEVSAAS